MLQEWKFNNIDLCTDDWNVETVIEGLGPPKLRGNNVQVPYTHGQRRIKKRYESRPYILGMWVRGSDVENLDNNIDTLNKLFGKLGEYELKRIMKNGEKRIAMAEVIDSIHFPIQRPGLLAKFTVEFQLADPFFYSIAETVEKIDIAENEQMAIVENIGTAPTNKMKILLNGPLESPKISNLSNDIWLEYQGNIAEGDSVEIDIDTFSCTKDGENRIAAIKHGGSMTWLILESGENNIKIENNAVGGNIEIKYYPAYF